MANRKRDAGREALEKKGWWRSHRWLVLRRLCQFFVLGMFLSGPWFGVWILTIFLAPARLSLELSKNSGNIFSSIDAGDRVNYDYLFPD